MSIQTLINNVEKVFLNQDQYCCYLGRNLEVIYGENENIDYEEILIKIGKVFDEIVKNSPQEFSREEVRKLAIVIMNSKKINKIEGTLSFQQLITKLLLHNFYNTFPSCSAVSDNTVAPFEGIELVICLNDVYDQLVASTASKALRDGCQVALPADLFYQMLYGEQEVSSSTVSSEQCSSSKVIVKNISKNNLSENDLINRFKFYTDSEYKLTLCLPKGMDLRLLGYNDGFISEITLPQFKEKVEKNSPIPSQNFGPSMSTLLPKLFVDSSSVKKRLWIAGHGRSNALNEDNTVIGMNIQDAKNLIETLDDKKNLESLCLLSCYLGGQNSIDLFKEKKYSSTITLMSIGDIPTRCSGIYIDFLEYWKKLNKYFSTPKKNPEWLYKAHQAFNQIGSILYPEHLTSSEPLLRIPGNTYFCPIKANPLIRLITTSEYQQRLLHPNKKSIPIHSIYSHWANSEKKEDLLNHCDYNIQTCQILSSIDPDHKKIPEDIMNKYVELKCLYSSSLSTAEQVEKVRCEIAILENNAKPLFSNLDPSVLEADRKYFLIYPKIIEQTIVLKKVVYDTCIISPIIMPMTPGSSKTVIQRIESLDFTAEEIARSLLRTYARSPRISAAKVLFIGEIAGKIEEYQGKAINHLIAIADEEMNSIIWKNPDQSESESAAWIKVDVASVKNISQRDGSTTDFDIKTSFLSNSQAYSLFYKYWKEKEADVVSEKNIPETFRAARIFETCPYFDKKIEELFPFSKEEILFDLFKSIDKNEYDTMGSIADSCDKETISAAIVYTISCGKKEAFKLLKSYNKKYTTATGRSMENVARDKGYSLMTQSQIDSVMENLNDDPYSNNSLTVNDLIW